MNTPNRTASTLHSKRHRARAAIGAALLFTAAVCGGCAPPSPPADDAEAKHTLFVYMCGSSLERVNGSASENLRQLTEAALEEGVNIVVQTGGTTRWHTSIISAASTDRYEIADGALRLVWREPTKQNFGAPETLAAFLEWGAAEYPAEAYSLILWNHGGGTLGGVCYDENFEGDSLSLTELDAALQAGVEATGQKFAFVGMDACLMATVETAFVLEPYAEHMIASQELEPESGWDYTVLAEHLGKADLYSAVLSAYAARSAGREYYTLSHIDLTRFESTADAFARLVAAMQADETPRTVVDALNAGLRYGSWSAADGDRDLYDLGMLFQAYGIEGGLEGVECVSGGLRSGATGLSVYFPLRAKGDLEAYAALSPYAPYLAYLEEFYSRRSEESISFERYLTLGADGRVSFTLTQASRGNVQAAVYTMYASGADGAVYQLGSDVLDVTDGETDANLAGAWIAANGIPICCDLVETDGTISLYAASVDVDFYIADLFFTCDASSGEIAVVGVLYDEDPTGIVYALEEGAEVVFCARTVRADGSMHETPIEGTQVVYAENAPFLSAELLPDGEYVYEVSVIDVYGTAYAAGAAAAEMAGGVWRAQSILPAE